MKNLALLIKPASGLCNMGCVYCFYRDASARLGQLSIMSEDIASLLIKNVFDETPTHVSFAFQGGEPTLAGLDYFKSFVTAVNNAKPEAARISYSIQTNGTLIDEEWAEFFAENDFLVGLSMDGDSELHNTFRPDASGLNTHSRVSASYKLLTKYGVPVNILCVVTSQLARRGVSVYSFFKRQGYEFLQFIPCLDPSSRSRGQEKYSLTPQRYVAFLKTVFDLWYRDWLEGEYISVRLFDDYVHLLCGRQPGTCASAGVCGKYFVIESSGDVYPCDFYVENDLKLGNIQNLSFTQLAQSDSAAEFLLRSQKTQPPECRSCEYRMACRGGCMRDRFSDGGIWHNYYCSAFKEFFNYSFPRLKYIAQQELRASSEAQNFYI